MTSLIFLDSSFLIAADISEDGHHLRSTEILNDIVQGKYGTVFVSDYVFDEAVTYILSKTKNLDRSIRLGEAINSSWELLKLSEEEFNQAWEVFKKQNKTTLSFTDCTILVLMRKNKIRNIATFDKEFGKLNEINVVV